LVKRAPRRTRSEGRKPHHAAAKERRNTLTDGAGTWRLRIGLVGEGAPPGATYRRGSYVQKGMRNVKGHNQPAMITTW